MADIEQLQRRIGTTLRDKWLLERLLGVGGMAAVYVGVHKIGRRDAIKILHPEAAQSRELCVRFEREARAANSFRHPGAVEIRDIDVAEDGAPFLVMELCVGASLAERSQRAPALTLRDLLRYVEQVLDVLVAAHAQGIIHRDIKPDNLFVLDDGRVKLLDFGIARIRQGPGFEGTWTKTGLTLGTTAYMPPEQARGRQIDARADVFAVGATLFRLLAGRRIHEAPSDFDLLLKMAREPAPALASAAVGVPREVCLVVDRALAFDREQRYPDAASMLADVRALLKAESPPYALAHAGDPSAATVAPGLGAAVARLPALREPTLDEISVVWSPVSSTMPTQPMPPRDAAAHADDDDDVPVAVPSQLSVKDLGDKTLVGIGPKPKR